MNRKIIPLLTLLLLPTAAAHDTIAAGNVSLEWHTDTNELLQVDGDTTLTLTLSVGKRVLKASDCRCALLLYSGAVSPRVKPTVLKTQVDRDGHLSAVITVDKAGSYSLVVDGKPLKLTDFAPFRTTIALKAAEDVFNAEKK